MGEGGVRCFGRCRVDQTGAFEGEDHLVHGGWTDAEVALHIVFGGWTLEHV
jgi:hypothetical protein